MLGSRKTLVRVAAVAIAAVLLYAVWVAMRPQGLPAGFAESNGRIEAVEIDIAAKTPGRVETVDVAEGDFVEAGQLLAKMDTTVLEAQLREAQANLERARIGVQTAEDQVRQQEAQKQAAQAVIAQRQAELGSAQKNYDRAKALVERNTAPVQQLDDTTAALEGGKAALAAAQAQLAAADAALSYARSGVVAAHAAVDAAKATVERIGADIDDSSLRAPLAGRVQYRVVQPGEVVAAGGVVLNMVDLTDVYMNFFLPTEAAGRLTVGNEVHLVLDAAPQWVIPAEVTYVADVAQFTPKTVETEEEREKLMFRVKARISRELLEKYVRYVKTGVPGVAYVRLDPDADWPDDLKVRLPQGEAAR